MLLFQLARRVAWLLCALAVAGNLNAATPLRDWQPEDSVRLRYFYDSAGQDAQSWPHFARAEELVRVSPQGEFFFLGTRQGDLKCDCTHSTLWVYSVAQVRQALANRRSASGGIKPLHTVRMSSAAPDGLPAIWQAAWEDPSTVMFRGYGTAAKEGLYRLDVRTGEVQQLFEVQSSGKPDEKMYLVSAVLRGPAEAFGVLRTLPAERLPNQYPKLELQGLHGSVKEWLEGRRQSLARSVEIFVRAPSQAVRPVISYLVPAALSVGPFDLSPDGAWLVAAVPTYEVPTREGEAIVPPSGWERYEGLSQTDARAAMQGYHRLWRYTLQPVAGGGATRTLVEAPRGPLSMAPSAPTPELFWSADSKHVVLVNTNLPLEGDEVQRRAMGYLVDYDVRANRWSVLEPMMELPAAAAGAPGGATYTQKVQQVGWLREGRELLVKYAGAEGRPAGGKVYVLSDNGWQSRPATPSEDLPAPSLKLRGAPRELPGKLRVVLRQSVNDPPKLYVIEGRSEAELLPPDEVLSGIWWARQQTVEWTEREGHVEQGQLLLPRRRPGSGPLPMVVQLESSSAGQFRPDGASSTAYAAQALVAQGMAVLRVDGELGKDFPKMAPESLQRISQRLEQERVDAAVAKLAEEGLIDPHRVGMVGFSRPGYFISYLITHPKGFTPAAAIMADSLIESYGEYIYLAGISSKSWQQAQNALGMNQKNRLYGGTFWRNKRTWIEEAPMFNVERVETPTLFTCNEADVSDSSPVSQILEIIAAYRLADRELDVQLFPGNFHELTRPHQRLASLQLTVDWMNFWLQDRTSPDPQKVDQNRSWEMLREHRNARLTKAAASRE